MRRNPQSPESEGLGRQEPEATWTTREPSPRGGRGKIKESAGDEETRVTLQGMEFLRRANPLPPAPLSPQALLRAHAPPAPHGSVSFPLPGPPGPRSAREPGAPDSSRGFPAGTHPARHLRGHVRLRGCSWALDRTRPRRARARVPAARPHASAQPP